MGMRRLTGYLITMHKYLMAWCEEDRARLLLMGLSDRTKGNWHKMKYRKFHLNIRKIYCENDHTLEQVAPSSCGVSILEDIKNRPGHSSDQPALVIML